MYPVSLCNKVLVSLKTQQDGNRTDGPATGNGNRERGTWNGRQQATGQQDNRTTGRQQEKSQKKRTGFFETDPPPLYFFSVSPRGSALEKWDNTQTLLLSDIKKNLTFTLEKFHNLKIRNNV